MRRWATLLFLCFTVLAVACSGGETPSDAGLSGVWFTVEVPEGATLDCDFPDVGEITICEPVQVGEDLWTVAAADTGNWWNGSPRRTRLVTLRIEGDESGRIVIEPMQIDDDEGGVVPPLPLRITIGK